MTFKNGCILENVRNMHQLFQVDSNSSSGTYQVRLNFTKVKYFRC